MAAWSVGGVVGGQGGAAGAGAVRGGRRGRAGSRAALLTGQGGQMCGQALAALGEAEFAAQVGAMEGDA